MRRIIVHCLRPEYKGLITATRGQAKKPTLYELESLLANEGTLDSSMFKVSIKEEEKALFTRKRGSQAGDRRPANKQNNSNDKQGPWQQKKWKSNN